MLQLLSLLEGGTGQQLVVDVADVPAQGIGSKAAGGWKLEAAGAAASMRPTRFTSMRPRYASGRSVVRPSDGFRSGPRMGRRFFNFSRISGGIPSSGSTGGLAVPSHAFCPPASGPSSLNLLSGRKYVASRKLAPWYRVTWAESLYTGVTRSFTSEINCWRIEEGSSISRVPAGT